jgi:hypothetical protein
MNKLFFPEALYPKALAMRNPRIVYSTRWNSLSAEEKAYRYFFPDREERKKIKAA